MLRVALDEREVDRERSLAAACCGKLRPAGVETDRACTAWRQPGSQVARPAAEIENITSGDVA